MSMTSGTAEEDIPAQPARCRRVRSCWQSVRNFLLKYVCCCLPFQDDDETVPRPSENRGLLDSQRSTKSKASQQDNDKTESIPSEQPDFLDLNQSTVPSSKSSSFQQDNNLESIRPLRPKRSASGSPKSHFSGTENAQSTRPAAENSRRPFSDTQLIILPQQDNSSDVGNKASIPEEHNAEEIRIPEQATTAQPAAPDYLSEADFSGADPNERQEVKIIGLEENFDFDPDNLGFEKGSLEYLEAIKNRAKTFEERVGKYRGTNYSLAYFVLDENLTRLVEYLDKVKLHDNEALLKEKISIIDYIKSLQEKLDSNVTEE